MPSIRPWLQKAAIIVLTASASPVIAGLIYDWHEDSGSTASGSIEFADYVKVGDIADPETDVISFTFNNDILPDWSKNDLALDTAANLELGEYLLDLTLSPPTTSSKKKTGTKTKTAYLDLGRGDASLFFTSSKTKKKVAVKKKATSKKKASAKTKTYVTYYWDWLSDTPQTSDAGFGYWTLQGGPVPAPEPSSLLLVLAGIAAARAAWRRARRSA